MVAMNPKPKKCEGGNGRCSQRAKPGWRLCHSCACEITEAVRRHKPLPVWAGPKAGNNKGD